MEIKASENTPPEVRAAIEAAIKEGGIIPDGVQEVRIMSGDELKKMLEGGDYESLGTPIPMGSINADGTDNRIGLEKGLSEGFFRMLADMVAKSFDLTNLPYNGVEGDSCNCAACNLRRLMKGPNEDLDAEREIDDDDIANLKKRAEDEEALNKLFETLPDIEPNNPEFDKLDIETRALLMRKNYRLMDKKLGEKIESLVETGMKVQALFRILELMAMKVQTTHEAPKGLARVAETLIMKMAADGLESIGIVEKEEDKKD